MIKRYVFFLWLALVALAILSYGLFNSDDYHLFIKPDVGGHGHGYIYYDDGSRTQRVPIGYENEISLRYADLSPDGSKIAFKKNLFLNIYDLHSNQLTQINLGVEANIPLANPTIQWSPDGSQIGFSCNLAYDGPIQVCTWDVAKGEMRVLSDLQTYGKYDYLSFGGWSADAKTIAFVMLYPVDDSGNRRQLILKLDTSNGHLTEVLDSEQAGLDLYPEVALSPDGKTILFSGNTLLEEQNEDYSYALYRINSDGSGLHRLIALDGWALIHPVWDPDGCSFYVSASDYYTYLPLQFNLSGRLIGMLPFQTGRMMLSWRRAISGE